MTTDRQAHPEHSKDNTKSADQTASIERARLAINTGAAAVAGAIAPDLTSAVAAALLTFIPAALSFAVTPVFERQKARAKKWWDEVVFENATDEGVAAAIEARLTSDPNAQDTIVAGLRDAMNAIASEVVPALAMLTREYAQAGRKPDRFFRGVSRLLSDLVAEEYKPLRNLIQHIATAAHVDERGQVELHIKPMDQSDTTMVTDEVAVAYYGETAGFNWLPDRIPHASRLFDQLKLNGLATDVQIERWDSSARPFSMVMERALAARIAKLLSDRAHT